MFALRGPHHDDYVDGDDYDDDASPTFIPSAQRTFRQFECLQLNSVNDSIINDGTINAVPNA